MSKVPKEFIYVIMVRHLEGLIYNNEAYVLGIFSKKMRAIKAAEIEEDERGGKYKAMWFQAPLNVSIPLKGYNHKYLLPKRKIFTCCVCKKTNISVRCTINPFAFNIHGDDSKDYYCEDCYADIAENI